MAHDVDDTSTINFVSKGCEIIKKAVENDNSNNYDTAYNLYSLGIQYLSTALKYEGNDVVKEAIQHKIKKFLTRAERISICIGKTSPKIKYVWRLPRFTEPDAELLCNGYIHREINESQQYIPIHIINTFIVRYFQDSDIVNKIKNASNTQAFESNCFEIGEETKCKWFIDFYPNGYSTDTVGSCDIFLNLLSIPPMISEIELAFKIIVSSNNNIMNNDFYKPSFRAFSSTEPSATWENGKFTNQDVLKMNDSITIELLIYSLIIKEKYSENKQCIRHDEHTVIDMNDITKCLPIPMCKEYIWNINDKESLLKIKNLSESEALEENTVLTFVSPIFVIYGLKWCLKFYPNGSESSTSGDVSCFLQLMTAIESIAKYVVKFSISLQQNNHETFQLFHTFSKLYPGAGILCDPLKSKDLSKFDNFTIKTNISLIGVYKNDKIQAISFVPETVSTSQYDSQNILWNINPKTMSSMKKVEIGDSFRSKTFTMYGIEWYLRFWPLYTDNNAILQIHNLIPFKQISISIQYQFRIREMKSIFVSSAIYQNDLSLSSSSRFRISRDKFNSLQHCTFEIRMELIDVYAANNQIVQKYIHQTKSTQREIRLETNVSSVIPNQFYSIKQTIWSITDAIQNSSNELIGIAEEQNVITTLMFYLKRLNFGHGVNSVYMGALRCITSIFCAGFQNSVLHLYLINMAQCDGFLFLRLLKLMYFGERSTSSEAKEIINYIQLLLQKYYEPFNTELNQVIL